jgi:hypothetical protein
MAGMWIKNLFPSYLQKVANARARKRSRCATAQNANKLAILMTFVANELTGRITEFDRVLRMQQFAVERGALC